jgi:glyoxylase-like metal-dependent hydrolase (beta-lactamase superfamily II)
MAAAMTAFFDLATCTVTYLIADTEERCAAVIDPVLDYQPNAGRITTLSADAVLAAARDQHLTIDYVLETHAHADHLTAADYLRRKTGAKVMIGAGIAEVQAVFAPRFDLGDLGGGADFDRLLTDGDALALGAQTIHVMATPGHTASCLTYRLGDAAFVGDTLFMPDYGTARTDFPGGDAASLYRSIRRILALPAQTDIYVGHDYLPEGRTEYRWRSTVAEQRRDNIHIHDGIDEAEFVAMRRARDATLSPPALILPALQVNIRAGVLPTADTNGRRWLKIPLTMEA